MTRPPIAEEVRSWTFEAALPFWAAYGVDRVHGGFVEALTPEGAPAPLAFKRTRVTARQTYVFAHAALLGWRPGAALAAHGVAFLERAWMKDSGGFARSVDVSGAPLDTTLDLYENAFAIFALVWAGRALGDGRLGDRAAETLDVVTRRLAHPSGRGLCNALPHVRPRLQNPHMHLFEAVLAGCATGDVERFGPWAHRLADLFMNTLFRRDTGIVRERFDESWDAWPGPDAGEVEPGHHFEWAWLLGWYQQLFGGDHVAAMRALVGFAEKHGVDPRTGATWNTVTDLGAPIDRRSRTWPNTERVKGWLSVAESGGGPMPPQALATWRRLFDTHLAVEPRGTWVDVIDGDDRPVRGLVPASTFYHVFMAAAETLRFDETSMRREASAARMP